ncbi:tRNA pseudouridine synthase D TruD [Desulfarculus baarsii DSM 2075]|uniref:tRNA pseudouridine synthase D n=1 Tax=Desulfarculus baarsii (strain ATCC 33931 / DSM 2075 / LMG 7858 / VKM B-1802 / 2st14) TaxID=644282 RepID=E1QII7_DESB2|nr:tRNA pseudouridine(13) synthase TruD [Desulfarculus baarsii]ADK84410.1 tRNA pseudouridine synthase D TruD [Desulfarculus baarsii DSM 2075]
MPRALPYVTADLPGVGGELKAEPSHFVVEELPLYAPDGQGEHIYVNLTRQGLTTKDVCRALAKALGLSEDAIGVAGQKDKHAITTQTFSAHLPDMPEETARQLIEANLSARVNWTSRHHNKLKLGHLLGNRFRILLSRPDDGAQEKAAAVAQALARRGLPNFFGPQRFGLDGDNAAKGRQAVLGHGPRDKWLRKLLCSAYQSQLFNTWLSRRMADGLFDRLLIGDVAKKTDTGGIFNVEDPDAEQPRLDDGRITYTGPIYGGKMLWAKDEAGQRERQILAEEDIGEADFKRARLSGSRRPARLVLDELRVEPTDQGLAFDFALPKGSYATVVLREFMKSEPHAPQAD